MRKFEISTRRAVCQPTLNRVKPKADVEGCSWGSSTPHMGAIFFFSLKDGAKPALPEGIFQIRSNVPRLLMVVTAIRICSVWRHGFSDVPRPLSTHTNTHTSTPGLLRWIECALPQWAFDAKTIEGLPVSDTPHECVCEGVAIWGLLCQGPSAPGLVDNGVLGGWKSDVQVSRVLEIWPPFTYCPLLTPSTHIDTPSYLHTTLKTLQSGRLTCIKTTLYLCVAGFWLALFCCCFFYSYWSINTEMTMLVYIISITRYIYIICDIPIWIFIKILKRERKPKIEF